MRVKPEEFDELFNRDTKLTPEEREQIRKTTRLILESYTELEQKCLNYIKELKEIRVKAGKFDKIKKNFKLPKNYPQ